MPMSAFENLMGGALSGDVLTAVLFGVVCVQASRYYEAFPDDAKTTKAMVGGLCVLQGFQLICVTAALYHYLIYGYSHSPTVAPVTVWYFTIFVITATISSATVQTFFALRLFHLSQSKALAVIVEIFVFAECVLGILLTWKSDTQHDFVLFGIQAEYLIIAWLATEAVTNTLIAGSMTFLLRRRRTGFKRTDSMLNQMAMFSVHISLVTTIIAIVILAVFVRYSLHWTVMFFATPYGTLFTVTLLSNLHSRVELKQRFTVHGRPQGAADGNHIGLSSLTDRSKPAPNITIAIIEETISDRPEKTSDARFYYSPRPSEPSSIGQV